MTFTLAARIRAGVAILAIGWASHVSGDTIIALDGNGGVAGQPGSVVGWGFSVTADAGVFPLFTGSQFLPDPNSVGSYTDYLASSFIFGLAGGSVIDPFNASTLTGAGEFDISPAAQLGSTVLGSLQLFWDEYSVSPDDPDFDPQGDFLSSGNSAMLNVAVTVGDTPISVPTPEPATFWFGALGIALIAAFGRRAAAKSSQCKRALMVVAFALTIIPLSSAFQLPPPVPTPTSTEQKAIDILRYPLQPTGILIGGTIDFGVFKIPIKGPFCHPDGDTAVPGSDPSVNSGCCGSPGALPCVAPVPVSFPPFLLPVPYGTNDKSGFYCTLPSSNVPQVDPYDSLLYCNLPKAQCDSGIPDSINVLSALKLNTNPQSSTFYFTSDIHFYRNGEWAPESNARHVSQINNFPGSQFTPNFFWPFKGSRAVSDPIGPPLGVIIGGDIGLDAHAGNLGAFRLMYEARSDVGASIQYPVFFGLGNHETRTQTNTASAHRMFDYSKNRMGSCGGVSQDPSTLNYSWDWGRIHMVMLNTWADDTSSLYNQNVAGHGLDWLAKDLQNNVGSSGKPVILFQHYEFTTSTPQVAGSFPDFWTTDDATNFLNVVKDYNIAGIFAGHTHIPAVQRLDATDWAKSTSSGTLRDSSGNEKVIDVFTNGTGGHLGTGDFIAIRYTDGGSKDAAPYLDVESIEWNSGDTIAIPGTLNAGPGNSGTYFGGQNGCRKRLNTRFNDLTSNSATALATLTTSSDGSRFPNTVLTVTLKNKNGAIPIPSQLAIQYRSAGQWVTNADFVDSCGVKGPSSSIPNNSYVLLSDAQVAALIAPGGSTQVQLQLNAFGGGGNESVALVAMTPLWGSDPSSLDPAIPGTPDKKFPTVFPQSFTVYGPPGIPFSLSCEYYNPPNPIGPQFQQTWGGFVISPTTTLNLVSPAPGSTTSGSTIVCDGSSFVHLAFDITGKYVVKLNIDANQEHVVNNDLPKLTLSLHTASNPFGVLTAVVLTPHLEAAVTIGVTVNPVSPHNPSAGPVLFTATLYDTKGVTPPTVPNTNDGGVYSPNNSLILSEAKLDSLGNILSTQAITTAFVGDSGRSDCQELFGNGPNGQFPGNKAQVVFGDVGGANPHFCPSLNALSPSSPWNSNSLSAGLHHFVVQYLGDNNFAPTQSAVFDYVVDAVSSLSLNSGSQQSTLQGTPFAQPLVAHVGAPAPGIAVTFTAPSTGVTGYFAGNSTTATAFTDPNGNATSPVFNANLNAGSYLVTATLPTVPNPSLTASFALTNTSAQASPLLTATLAPKAGPMNARVWTVTITNTQAQAAGVVVSSMTFNQAAGAACVPAIQTPFPITAGTGTILNGASASAQATIDFSSCAASARFTVEINLQANGGAYQHTTTIGNQFP